MDIWNQVYLSGFVVHATDLKVTEREAAWFPVSFG